MGGSDYDGKDQAYQEMLDENDHLHLLKDMLLAEIDHICTLIYYQEHLKHQDNWVAEMIKRGLFTPEEEGE